MIQAITYLTYWFTVAKTDQRKPLHMIEEHDMQQILLELGHHLVMVFMESRVLNPFVKYLGYCKEHTAQYKQPRYVCRVCIIAALVHPDAMTLKPVILKRK